MGEISTIVIEYRTACRLSDLIKVQFWCSVYMLGVLWLVLAVVVIAIFFIGGGTAAEFLSQPWNALSPMLAGAAFGFLGGPLIAVIYWFLGKAAKEIRADISDDQFKIFGKTVNFETSWSSLKWIKEGNAAYLLKFKGLLFRMPKRGFALGQEDAFRALVRDRVPSKAIKLKGPV